MLRLGAGTPTFLELAIDTASRLANDIMVIGHVPLSGVPTVRWLVDRFADSGPLAGVATALQESSCDRCLILPCDHPFLSTRLLKYIVSLPSAEDAVIPVTRDSSRQGRVEALQTLHAVYSRACLPLIEEHIGRGDFRTTSWLEQITIRRIDEDTIRRFDPELRSFFSVNTPQDLERARTIARSPAGPG